MNAREKLAGTENELSGSIYQRGVDSQGFGRIRSKGDQALFGGHTTFEMKKKLNVPDNRPLADFLPTITIKAKDLPRKSRISILRKAICRVSPLLLTNMSKTIAMFGSFWLKAVLNPRNCLLRKTSKNLSVG